MVSVAVGPGPPEVQPEQAVGEDREGVARRDGDRAEAHAQDERDRRGQPRPMSTRTSRPGTQARRPLDERTGRCELGAGRHRAPRYGATGTGEGTAASGWMARASSRRPSTSRGPGRVTTRSLTPRMSPVLDGGHHVPAGTGGDGFGGHAIDRVAQDDDLGIGRDELLDRDREVGRAAGRDRVAAGELDHLGDERVVGRGVDVGRRVELVEHARPGQVRGRGLDLVEVGAHAAVRSRASAPSPTAVADQLDVLEDRRDVRGVGHDDRRRRARAAA